MSWMLVRAVLFATAAYFRSGFGMAVVAGWTLLDIGVIAGRWAERRRPSR